MKNLFRKTTWMLITFMCVMTSCDKQEPIEQSPQKPQDGDIAVGTEIIVDGENVTNTRAASEAGYTTGDGLYDQGEKVTVAAFANDGYELTAFYDKKNSTVNLGSSHTFLVEKPQTFKAEFARKFTISASASPSDGGTVAGGGKYKNGASCALTATPNSGYTFDGWYEGSTKVSSNSSYSFTVSSNRTMTARFVEDTSIIKDNYVAVYCDYIGGEFVIEVTAKFPITTDIPFFYEIRGYYFDYGTSHEQQYGPDKTSVVLKKGGKAWRFVANPAGVPTGSPIYEVNWYTKMTQFSDDKYNYTGGYSSGIWK